MTKCFWLIMPFALILSSNSFAADECGEILQKGIKNTYSNVSTSDFKNKASSAFCAELKNRMSSGGGGGLSLSLPIKGVPIGIDGNYSQSEAQEAYNRSCSNNNQELSDNDYQKILQSVVDPEIVKAWSECKSKSGGLFINAELAGINIILSLKFRPVGNISSTRLVGDPVIINAICNPEIFKDKKEIGGSTQYQTCKRQGADEVLFIVNSEFDGVRYQIPAAKLDQPMPTTDVGPTKPNSLSNRLPGEVEQSDWPPCNNNGMSKIGVRCRAN